MVKRNPENVLPMAPTQQSSRARIRVLKDQLRLEEAGTAAAEAQLNLLRLQEKERPSQRQAPSAPAAAPQRPQVPPPAPRGEGPGQRQLDQLQWALDASAKMKRAQSEQRLATPPHLGGGGRPQTARQPTTAFGTARHSASRERNRIRTSPENMAAENRRLREEVRKLRSSGSMTSRQSTPNTDRRPSSAMARSASMGAGVGVQMTARPSSASMARSMTPSTSGHMAAILRRRQEAEDRLVREQAAETEAAWVDPAPWGSQGGPMPSSQWATESQAQFRPVAKQFLVPNGRTTARARSSEAAARNEERRKRAMEATGSLDFVKMGGKTLAQRYWDLHPGTANTPGCPPHKVAMQMKQEAAYSDVFQVRAPVGPGGYVRESQYRLLGKADANYKTQPLPPGDKRPYWRVAW